MEAVSAAKEPQNRFPYAPAQFQKGRSGNPGGRPKAVRSPSVALQELNDTPGDSLQEIADNFRAARGSKFCAADLKAIVAFERDLSNLPHGVSSFNSTTDRIDGPVPRDVNVKSEASLAVYIVPLYAMMDGKRAPELLEAEVVEDDKL